MSTGTGGTGGGEVGLALHGILVGRFKGDLACLMEPKVCMAGLMVVLASLMDWALKTTFLLPSSSLMGTIGMTGLDISMSF